MTQQRVLVLCGWLVSSGALAKDWKAGDLAIVEQDGKAYEAKIVSRDGSKYKVAYTDYPGEEEVVAKDRLRAEVPATPPAWDTGQLVLVEQDKVIYEAKILEARKGGTFRVQYVGWNSKETVKASRIRAMAPPGGLNLSLPAKKEPAAASAAEGGTGVYRECTFNNGRISSCWPVPYSGQAAVKRGGKFYECSFNNGNAYNCYGVPYSGRAVTYKDGAYQACDMSGGVPLNCDGVSYSGKAVLMRKE